MQVVIKAHVATIGYEDSNPFSLVAWAIEVASAGYTELVEQEFSICALTPSDKAIVDAMDDDDVIFVTSSDPDEIADNYDDISGYALIVQPIGDLHDLGEGDITATRV